VARAHRDRKARGLRQLSSLWANARFLLGRVRLWALVLAPAAAVAVAAGVLGGWYAPPKGDLEDLGIVVAAVFAVGCLARYAGSRAPWFLWATALMMSLLAREIRFQGVSTGIYVVLVLLAWWALRNLDRLRPHLAHPVLLTGLALGFTLYAIAVGVDQRWARGLPGEEAWQLWVEESLEVLGHFVIGATLVWSPKLSDEAR
jgi:hypothetical protein